jgi:GNAT superfamily N-acetyltransferase
VFTLSHNEVLIRQGHVQDIEDLIDLLRELFSIEEDFEFNEALQRRGLEQMLGDVSGKCIMVAERSGRVIGMCSAQILISTAEGGPAVMIEDMVVRSGYRGTGIGKGLLIATESWSVKKGVTRIQLLADKNNLPALEFYRKNEWATTRLICLRKKIEEVQG